MMVHGWLTLKCSSQVQAIAIRLQAIATRVEAIDIEIEMTTEKRKKGLL